MSGVLILLQYYNVIVYNYMFEFLLNRNVEHVLTLVCQREILVFFQFVSQ